MAERQHNKDMAAASRRREGEKMDALAADDFRRQMEARPIGLRVYLMRIFSTIQTSRLYSGSHVVPKSERINVQRTNDDWALAVQFITSGGRH